MIDDLNSRFGDRWVTLFKRWFEMNTGLSVYDMITENVISESVDNNTKKMKTFVETEKLDARSTHRISSQIRPTFPSAKRQL